ncbi:MAG: putative sulfate exporter family transporter [Isosphaeraceae bacterium]|nr:putative sulfate exporter family transporter [Isosphaeraceae bacterium]
MSRGTEVAYPHWATWLDSMEGVPEWPQPVESPAEQASRGALLRWGHETFGRLGEVLPGLGLALGLALAGQWGARWLGSSVLGFARSPISEISVAVLLGLVLRNTIGLPAVYERGLRLCLRAILRVGIVLLGFRLSLAAVGQIGLLGLPIIGGCIAAALVAVTVINRLLGLPRRLGSLIAVGTSICGVSAIVATAPTIDAEEDEVSYAVACVTLFGMLALFTYPFLAHGLFGADARRAGLFLGTAIHDTAQVAGAGLMYQQQFHAPRALNAATVTKLVRNLCMAGVIPLVGALYRRSASGAVGRARPRWYQMVPLFVVGFVAAAALRTLGDLGDRPFRLLDDSLWSRFLVEADGLAAWCLATAMAAVGLGTSLTGLRQLGWKPFCVGFAAAAVVGGVSFGLIQALGPYL